MGMRSITLKNIAFGLLIIILVVLAFATILEKWYDRDFALDHIYYTWWFVALWGLFALTSFGYILKQKLYKKRIVFALHSSFAIILIGAFTTFCTSNKGYLHLRQNKPTNSYTAEDEITRKPLPFTVQLVLFEIIPIEEGSKQAADYMSFIKIDGEMNQISMNKILKYKGYRLYQISYDSDEMGSILLVNYDPIGTPITYFGYFLLALTMSIILLRKIGWKWAGIIAIPTLLLWYYISQVNPMTPILRTPLLAIHVSIIFISYLLLLIMAIFGGVGIYSIKLRDKLFCWNKKIIYPALFMLTAGIFIGAVWANISWGRYWGWDAKETWALITMLIYAFPLHKKSFPKITNPLYYHKYCLFAFLTVLMTFLGVSFILGGIHSYI